MLDVVARYIRPTWDEIMRMDFAMLEAVLSRVPRLDDGSTGETLLKLLGGKPHA